MQKLLIEHMALDAMSLCEDVMYDKEDKCNQHPCLTLLAKLLLFAVMACL